MSITYEIVAADMKKKYHTKTIIRSFFHCPNIFCFWQGEGLQSTGKVTIITAVARKKVQPEKDKGELMENNVDLMEVWGLFGDFNLSKKR